MSHFAVAKVRRQVNGWRSFVVCSYAQARPTDFFFLFCKSYVPNGQSACIIRSVVHMQFTWRAVPCSMMDVTMTGHRHQWPPSRSRRSRGMFRRKDTIRDSVLLVLKSRKSKPVCLAFKVLAWYDHVAKRYPFVVVGMNERKQDKT